MLYQNSSFQREKNIALRKVFTLMLIFVFVFAEASLSFGYLPATDETSIKFQKKLNLFITQILQDQGSLTGQIKDELGGAIVGAEVIITDKDGKQLTAQTTVEGIYRFTNLPAGDYSLKVNAVNFDQI
jgi:hypothetical protein